MLPVISRVVLGLSAVVIVGQACTGEAVPVALALAAALVAPAAIVGASVPPGRRGVVTTLALAAVLLVAGVAVQAASRRIAGPARAPEILAWLVALLAILGLVPAVVLGWAHARSPASPEPDDGTPR